MRVTQLVFGRKQSTRIAYWKNLQWFVLRPKNLGFRYILRRWRKHALFMAEFVAEAISKCTIDKRFLLFGFATCALATLASRPMIRHSICNGMHLNVRSAVS